MWGTPWAVGMNFGSLGSTEWSETGRWFWRMISSTWPTLRQTGWAPLFCPPSFDFLDCARWGEFQYSMDLVGISLYSSLGDDKSKKFSWRDLENIFSWVEPHSLPPHGGEGLFEVCYMLWHAFAFDEHVIYVCFHVPLGLIDENLVHQYLVSCTSIL